MKDKDGKDEAEIRKDDDKKRGEQDREQGGDELAGDPGTKSDR